MCDSIHRGLKPETLALSRRNFLRATAITTLTLAVPASFLGGAGHAHAAEQTITATHGAGFCNLNLFLSHVANTVGAQGVDLELVTTPTFADEVTMIAAGKIDAGVIPYTSYLALHDAGVDIRIVGGGGRGGVGLVARPGLTDPKDFVGKTIGTFQLDTLELMAYDWLKMHGVKYSDLKVRYFDTTPDSVAAFMSGALDLVTTIEPYGTIIPKDKPGAVLLSDGSDVYGSPLYTDCVLGVRAGLIEQNPAAVKALIKGMMEAQVIAESDPDGTLQKLLGSYYKTDMDRGRIAMAKQPSVIDARNQVSFIMDRSQSLVEMGYIKKKPDASVFDFTLLNEVIAENPDIFGKLKIHA